MTSAEWRKYVAFGTGVGVAIGKEDLHIQVVRLRPVGVTVLGTLVVDKFHERPAAEWGGEYARFLKELRSSHLAATILLPRREVMVRQISMPGVTDRDLAAAVAFQADSLHPFEEGDIYYSYSRIGKTTSVLVGIVRRQVLDKYLEMFSEAAIKVASVTFSAAVLRSSSGLPAAPSRAEFIALGGFDDDAEIYGESEARPVFSVAAQEPVERSVGQASAELRLPADSEPLKFLDLLPVPRIAPADTNLTQETLPYATALSAACPWLSNPDNLLPKGLRATASRIIYIPTAVLALLLLVSCIFLFVQMKIADRRYVAKLSVATSKLERRVNRSLTLGREIEKTLARIQQIDDFRSRTKADLDALSELTNVLQSPAWLNQMELTRDSVTVAGEAEQAAPLLKVLDASPAFRNSEFALPISRSGSNEVFRIRMAREGAR